MKDSLIYLKGDIFSSPAEVIVNTVNTVGVMGKGLAADFKKKYPKMFKNYKQICKDKKFSIGQLIIHEASDYRVMLFPTKKHWRGNSKIEYIEAGLKKFVDTYAQKNITSIAFPKLGCGNGNLSWEMEVQPLMEKYLKELPIPIYIYLDKIEEKIPHDNKFIEVPTIIKTGDIFRADDPRLADLDLNQLCRSEYLLKILIQSGDTFVEGFQVNGGAIRKLSAGNVQMSLPGF